MKRLIGKLAYGYICLMNQALLATLYVAQGLMRATHPAIKYIVHVECR